MEYFIPTIGENVDELENDVFRPELMTDEKAELAYLLKADEDDGDLRAFASAARKSLVEFLSLVPRSGS